MGIINPETGAISNYLWVGAQEGIATILEGVSTAQSVINPDYAFQVHKNLYRPSIEDIENAMMVNVLIAKVDSTDEDHFSETHIVTYNIDCYVRGKNEDDPDNPGSLVPADEVAVQRLHYLCAMVESGLTNLYNFYLGLASGEIMPDKISLVFNPVDDASESATPYAPARFEFICKFPYTAQDLTGLPDLEQTFLDLGTWSVRVLRST